MTNRPVCVVVGIGPGNGAALARRFDREGYAVALLARREELSKQLASELTETRAFACDVGDPASVERAFTAIRAPRTMDRAGLGDQVAGSTVRNDDATDITIEHSPAC